MKQKAIIVDLDGTLCNTDHRQHFMQTNPKNWKSFYNALPMDKPHEWCVQLIDAMRMSCVDIIFVSGRPDTYREVTEGWLHDWGLSLAIAPYPLFMRKALDYRKDSVVKEEIYRTHIEPSYDVLFCVDDRQQVVDMWRSIGLTCLQCAKGDF
jgi:predicted secreted acid phosphatase